jgi:hypothetical protein
MSELALMWNDSPEDRLKDALIQRNTETTALYDALKEVMEWIDNWSPEFVCDDDWPETARKVDLAMAKVKE